MQVLDRREYLTQWVVGDSCLMVFLRRRVEFGRHLQYHTFLKSRFLAILPETFGKLVCHFIAIQQSKSLETINFIS
jgi:hypothetical protein